ncbi:hypothetical protein [Qipengyuania sp. RANM35]|uniref:hypothetical protein n=1 Tax=Qipengyuania sp. RANM35 TaxID=3068635 RepID=UPI0034DB1F32
MRVTKPIIIAAAAGMLCAVSGSAQESGATAAGVIASDTPGALDEPGTWNCSRIKPEYTDWLDTGHSPDSWRHFGKTYRDSQTDKLYTWQDWLDWAEGAGCFAGYAPEGVASPNVFIGGALTFFGAGLIAIQSGSGPKSPG